MDASISDILASVTRAHDASTSIPNYPSSFDTTTSAITDLHHLTRAWVAERVAPELLPYPNDLLDRVMERIREQIETIETRTARMDSGTSFALVIMQTELERFKFLVRSFLRARIAKIDAHPHHLLSLSLPQNQMTPPLLSPQESTYLQTHASLVSTHYTTSFLSSFPSKLRRLDDRAGAGSVGMVEGPDLEKAVFVRCLGVAGRGAGAGSRERGRGGGLGWEGLDDGEGDEGGDGDEAMEGGNSGSRFGPVEVSCGFTVAGEGDSDGDETMQGDGASDAGAAGREGEERIIRMRRGEVWLVRWSGVRDAVARGECELI